MVAQAMTLLEQQQPFRPLAAQLDGMSLDRWVFLPPHQPKPVLIERQDPQVWRVVGQRNQRKVQLSVSQPLQQMRSQVLA